MPKVKMMQLKRHSFALDLPLLWVTAVLLVFGLLMLLSTSMFPSETSLDFGSPWTLFFRQLMFLGLALVLSVLLFYVAASHRAFSLLLGHSFFLLAFCCGLLAMTLSERFGYEEVNGSTRWLDLGIFLVQPSEILKLVLVIYLTYCLTAGNQNYRSSVLATLCLLAPLVVLASFLAFQPDFGSIVVLFAVALGMLFVSGIKLRVLGVIAVLVIVPLGILLVTSEYRLERVLTFLDPWQDRWDTGYQLVQSMIAVGSGSWFGVGLDGSMMKLGYLPQAHTDFVFPVIAEELGFFGVLTVVVLFFLLVVRCLQIARRAEETGFMTGGIFCHGVGIWLGLQTFINMAMTVGILPTKGITLPLFSFGGSSMVVTLMSLALVHWVHHETCRRGKAMAPYRAR